MERRLTMKAENKQKIKRRDKKLNYKKKGEKAKH